MPIGIIIGSMGFIAQALALSFGLLAINAIIKKILFLFSFGNSICFVSYCGCFFLIFLLAIYELNYKSIKIYAFVLIISLFIYLLNMDRLNDTFYWYLGSGKHFLFWSLT